MEEQHKIGIGVHWHPDSESACRIGLIEDILKAALEVGLPAHVLEEGRQELMELCDDELVDLYHKIRAGIITFYPLPAPEDKLKDIANELARTSYKDLRYEERYFREPIDHTPCIPDPGYRGKQRTRVQQATRARQVKHFKSTSWRG